MGQQPAINDAQTMESPGGRSPPRRPGETLLAGYLAAEVLRQPTPATGGAVESERCERLTLGQPVALLYAVKKVAGAQRRPGPLSAVAAAIQPDWELASLDCEPPET